MTITYRPRPLLQSSLVFILLARSLTVVSQCGLAGLNPTHLTQGGEIRLCDIWTATLRGNKERIEFISFDVVSPSRFLASYTQLSFR